mmetsp:Transcript_76790/g.135614  ORF Transcript_76790/g.135614 Transcript_76790/m.135614 type:complete len:108 (-) Transcript_76790:98-421(-)
MACPSEGAMDECGLGGRGMAITTTPVAIAAGQNAPAAHMYAPGPLWARSAPVRGASPTPQRPIGPLGRASRPRQINTLHGSARRQQDRPHRVRERGGGKGFDGWGVR